MMQFTFDRKSKDAFEQAKIKTPVDLQAIIDDLKVCGRAEL